MSDLDMPISPETQYLLKLWRDGNDPNRPEKFVHDMAKQGSDYVFNLSSRKKGEVIIELVTIAECLSQAISIMKTQQMEEGQ